MRRGSSLFNAPRAQESLVAVALSAQGAVSRAVDYREEDQNYRMPLSAVSSEPLVGGDREKTTAVPAAPTGLVMSAPTFPGPIYHLAKRSIDILGALVGLVLLAPVILLVILLVGCDSRGPIFHRRRVLGRQTFREGRSLSTFDAFKFRTMVPNADAVLRNDPVLYREYQREFKLRHDPRITRIGQHLRRISVDEIPQLLNVLRGQMTLVGPRMISPPELEMYGARAEKLLSVKPGLTGLWQVSGRQNTGYAERIRLDMWYIDHRSPRLDAEIMLRTIGSVLGRRGAF